MRALCPCLPRESRRRGFRKLSSRPRARSDLQVLALAHFFRPPVRRFEPDSFPCEKLTSNNLALTPEACAGAQVFDWPDLASEERRQLQVPFSLPCRSVL